MKSTPVRRRKLNVRADIAKQLDVELPPQSEKTISPNEAAAMLGITGEAVKQWVYHGRLPAVKLQNGYWRIKVTDLSRFLEKRIGGPKHSILICESDPQTALAMNATVEELGHDALVANSAIDAILKARNERPSVMILDLTHPSGFSLLQKMDASFARNILLLMGAELTAEQLQIVTDSGAKAVLQKPLDPEALKRELKRVVGK